MADLSVRIDDGDVTDNLAAFEVAERLAALLRGRAVEYEDAVEMIRLVLQDARLETFGLYAEFVTHG